MVRSFEEPDQLASKNLAADELTWDAIPFHAKLKEILIANQFERPSEIQFKVLNTILPKLTDSCSTEKYSTETFSSGNYCAENNPIESLQQHRRPVISTLPGDSLIMSETGSGKTLAYLLPIFERILLEDKLDFRKRSPFALILVPTAELVLQVKQMIHNFISPPSRSTINGTAVGKKVKNTGNGETGLPLSGNLPIIGLSRSERVTFSQYVKALKIHDYQQEKTTRILLDSKRSEPFDLNNKESFERQSVPQEFHESPMDDSFPSSGEPDVTLLTKPMYRPIFISTPGVLFNNNSFSDISLLFSSARFVVIDEADLTLQGDTDLATSNTIFRMINKRSDAILKGNLDSDNAWSKMRFILVAATVAAKNSQLSLNFLLTKKMPDIERIISTKNHSISSLVRQNFIEVDRNVPLLAEEYRATLPTDGLTLTQNELLFMSKQQRIAKAERAELIFTEKVRSLLTYLQSIQVKIMASKNSEKKNISMVVFVNTASQATKLYGILSHLEPINKKESSVQLEKYSDLMNPHEIFHIFHLNRDVETHVRKLAIDEFVLAFKKNSKNLVENSNIAPTETIAGPSPRVTSQIPPRISVLVSTDMAARGLDFDNLDIVFQFDFCLDAISYIHRVGRTGRMGTPGHAIHLITQSDQLLASKIREHQYNCLEPCFSSNRAINRQNKRFAEKMRREAEDPIRLSSNESITSIH